jgi:hypothetical protein|tara:strand:- start:365 stop:613 length:249 start_codon:yes stop_codon:yes gene_type:complete
MKFVMVIIICFGATCQSIFEQHFYDTEQECLNQSQSVKQYMMDTYPQSRGEIYCMTYENFQQYNEELQNGKVPVITDPGDPA